MTDPARPYEICGVVHLVRPLGRSALDLASLRAGVADVEPASLFYHAVQPPLRAPAAADLPRDDFSAWVGGVLQDYETAERLSFATQRAGPGPDALRTLLFTVLDRPGGAARSATSESAFSFLATDSVPVAMEECDDVETLLAALTRADASAWFYHFVEQPWFDGGRIPVLEWLRGRGGTKLAARLEPLVTSGLPLETLRRECVRTWRRSQLGGRVARAAAASEADRANEARGAVARLARRIVRGGDAS